MHTYHFSDASRYTFEQLTEMHNTSFSGYFVPITMTPAGTADFWRIHQIDANLCVIMHDEHETFVGMARMGTRGKRGWCGGFGIVPEFRGTGASKLLGEQMVKVAREAGLETLQLEVLAQNTRAFKLYEKIGFSDQRQLVGIEIETELLPTANQLQIKRETPERLLPWLGEGNRPSWGRELPTILSQDCVAVTFTGSQGEVNGLIVKPSSERIIILATWLPETLSPDQFGSLLQQAANGAPKIQVYNEPEDSAFLTGCRAIGFREFFRQHEMFLKL